MAFFSEIHTRTDELTMMGDFKIRLWIATFLIATVCAQIKYLKGINNKSKFMQNQQRFDSFCISI